jgi:NAD(P)-dependent dehydrogenase (short-subunit alcohol dehydrogenase family)
MAEDARRAGLDIHYRSLDVTDDGQVEDLVHSIVEQFGRLDVAFNNAGYGMPSGLLDQTPQTWRKTVETNLTGVWSCLRHEIRAMVDGGTGGTIVNNASVYGLIGMSALSDYAASKHGVVGLTKSVALEFAPHNIRVNAVCSGAADTAMLRRQIGPADPSTALAHHYPLGRIATVEEIAETVVWLCSPSAAFLTGVALAVDGGATAA